MVYFDKIHANTSYYRAVRKLCNNQIQNYVIFYQNHLSNLRRTMPNPQHHLNSTPLRKHNLSRCASQSEWLYRMDIAEYFH